MKNSGQIESENQTTEDYGNEKEAKSGLKEIAINLFEFIS